MNIGIGCPTPESVPAEFALDNLPSIIAYTKKHLAPTDNIYLSYQMGVRTDRNRNIILKRFIDKGDIDYVLWLDVDMLYPHSIICEYLEHDFDVMGCLYFKRAEGFEPVGYINSKNPLKPFSALDPRKIMHNEIYKVDGLGFGGMMVNMKVYKAMGEDKWHKYSDNYHLPEAGKEPRLTHDLYFCQKVKEYGFDIMLHGNVRPGHLTVLPVTQDDYFKSEGSDQPIYSTSWFVRNVKNWEEKLHDLGKRSELEFLEVGSYEGRSARWSLEHFPQAKITCVDDFSGSGYLKAENLEQHFWHNLEPYKDRVTVMKGKSQEILPTLPDSKYDYVYIDGSHTYPDVVKDAAEAWRLCKADGIICFDDYIWFSHGTPYERPKEAIDEFLVQHQGEYELLHKGAQVMVKKLKETAAKKDQIVVIMPTIHPELAEKTAKILSSRAGIDHKMVVIEDKDRQGYAKTANRAVKEHPADYYVYLTDDIFPSRNWLLTAMEMLKETKCTLCGFNDGKWNGAIATCGLVSAEWIAKNYQGELFFPGYFGHYNDTELTILAMNDHLYCYTPDASLIEIDYDKETKPVNKNDHEIFCQRKDTKFDNRVTDEKLIAQYQ